MHRRRRAVAGSRVGADAGVRRTPALGRARRAGVRRARRRRDELAGLRSSRSRGSAPPTPARSWTPRCPGRSTSACATGSWPRRRAIRSRCWSCRAGCPRRRFGLPGSMPLISRIEQGFVRQLEPLPGETRQLLLLAAAEPVGDVTLLRRAAELLGIEPDTAVPAEAAGLIDIGARVRFRHPLVRSAAYRAASVPDRRDVHRALAEATDPQIDPDRRAWHRAHAAARFDEAVAGELERSADRARSRGGIAAAAAFLERAAELTPDPARAAGGRWPPRRPSSSRGRRRPRRSSWQRGEVPAGRAPERPARPSARAVRVRVHARHRRSATTGRSRRTARGVRSRVGAPDLPRGARRGDVRRAPEPRLRRVLEAARARPGAAPAALVDLVSTDWHAVHGGARSGRAGAAARARGLRRRGARRSRGDRALALLSPIVQSIAVFELWTTRIPRARHPRGATGP